MLTFMMPSQNQRKVLRFYLVGDFDHYIFQNDRKGMFKLKDDASSRTMGRNWL